MSEFEEIKSIIIGGEKNHQTLIDNIIKTMERMADAMQGMDLRRKAQQKTINSLLSTVTRLEKSFNEKIKRVETEAARELTRHVQNGHIGARFG